MNISEQLLYNISISISQILNLYLNNVEHKFPFYFLSFLKNRRIPRNNINAVFYSLKKNLIKNNLNLFFNIDFKKSVEDNIISTVIGFENLINNLSNVFKSKIFLRSELKQADLKNLYGKCGEQNELISLIRYIYQFKNYFKIVLINGSIGSRDYKPGWSDVDLFIIINNQYLISKNKLRDLRKITLNIKKLIMTYSILQLHGVYYSSEEQMKANYNEFFPIACLETGQIINDLDKFELKIPNNKESALNYFRSIYKNSKLLYNQIKIKKLDIFSQILLFHRIYSFPFSFLQCLGFNIGKKESFKVLTTKFQDLFPKISDFYNEVNRFYLNWKIDKIRTYKFRKFLSHIFSLEFLNRIFLQWEKSIINKIENHFKQFLKKRIFNEFNKFLDIANSYIIKEYPSYQNPFRPYLDYEFYEKCIHKIQKLFSNIDEIIAIYRFGSIKAPGNSDIDLIFVVKNNIQVYDKIVYCLKTRFTSNEKFIVFQHKPFVITEDIAKNLNYILPCEEITKIYGKDIIFNIISNPYVKLAMLIELLIFTKPIPFPVLVNIQEDFAKSLQQINTMNYIMKQYLEIIDYFDIGSEISFKYLRELLKKNDYIRKNMYTLPLNSIKTHIDNSCLIMRNYLLRIKLEIAHFIENNGFNQKIIKEYKRKPVLRFGSYFFIFNEEKLKKINLINNRSYLYNPWSFYFFFKNQECLKKKFYKGIKERNKILIPYLRYTLIYNNNSNLYVPFWYRDKKRNLNEIIWNLVPKTLKNKYLFYFYFWQKAPRLYEIILLPLLLLKKFAKNLFHYLSNI